ncbi:PREDICTED: probable D-tyrosyl-tRNA(Tyr) deacylase 2 [Priapulus caudatus]|uniref:D-aminoacyl-tRNA deacylase n=1 Tax=Priapulus caudatus TaxID=37621 RepID=A0ABM1FB59_PRICU|nr:PREDICTED: probable D-tyrosyl-tRNA(Tyr) deacylase 2 [Priapulus caudatus]XP_014681680.1 PREDICTED: probable D-tyrosyl-tRNA(Tyr) deacylase 2 [Priapulus caudatus]
MATENVKSSPKARVVVQQCLSAKLMVQPPSDDHAEEAKYVEIKRGVVLYISFLKGATENIVTKMVSSLLAVRLCEPESGKLVSVMDLPGSILIVPQACLGGKMKGKAIQYHDNLDKTEGRQLYDIFVSECTRMFSSSVVNHEASTTCVRAGTYGNRQVLSINTNGPYTHIFDFS